MGSRGQLHFCDSKLTAKINSSAWVCLSSSLLRGSGEVTSLQAPAASSTPNSPVSYCHPKASGFQPVPGHPPRAAALPTLDGAVPSRAVWLLLPAASWRAWGCGAACACLPVLSAAVHTACVGPLRIAQMGCSKRNASLPAVKINRLGLKQLLGKPLCFRTGTKYLQGLLQQTVWSSLLYHISLQGFGKNVKQILVHRCVSDFFPSVGYTLQTPR